MIEDDDDEGLDQDAEDDINFNREVVDIGNWVLICCDGETFVGNVEEKDPEKGYFLQKYVSFSDANFFTCCVGQDNWYKDINFIIDAPAPANNRGALKLSDSDYGKYRSLKY